MEVEEVALEKAQYLAVLNVHAAEKIVKTDSTSPGSPFSIMILRIYNFLIQCMGDSGKIR